jgi:hypothetical protein
VPTPACAGKQHTRLLSKLWYVAQILPIPAQYARQIIAVILWYIWRGGIFRVPVSTLYRKGRRLKSGGRTGEMHDAILIPPSPASGKLQNNKGGMAGHLGEVHPKGQPTTIAVSPEGYATCVLTSRNRHT